MKRLFLLLALFIFFAGCGGAGYSATPQSNDNPLFAAISIEAAKSWIDRGNLYKKGKSGRTIFEWALYGQGRDDVLEYILKQGVDVNKVFAQGTPLELVIGQADIAKVKLLLKYGADMEKVPKSVLAALARSRKTYKSLANDAKANNIRQIYKNKIVDIDHMKKFLKPYFSDKYNASREKKQKLLMQTKAEKQNEMLKAMWAKQPLSALSASKVLKKAKEWIGQGRLKEEDGQGNTVFDYAISMPRPNMAVVKYLIESGAELNPPHLVSSLPLFIAVRSQSLELIKYLISQGADMHKVDDKGSTILHYAVGSGKLEIVKYFVDQGFDPLKLNHDNQTAKDMTVVHMNHTTKLMENQPEYRYIYEPLVNEYKKIVDFLDNSDPYRKEFFLAKKMATVKAYKNFIHNYPKSNFVKQAKIWIENKKATEVFKKVKKSKSHKQYQAFVEKYPHAKESKEARQYIFNTRLERLKKQRSLKAYDKFLALFPDYELEASMQEEYEHLKQDAVLKKIAGYLEQKNIKKLIEYVQKDAKAKKIAMGIPKLALLFTGPEEMLVVKVLHYKKQGLGDAILASKIKSLGKPYREFSFDEIISLKKYGMTEQVLAAMLDVTTEYKKEQKRKQEQQALLEKQQKLAQDMQDRQNEIMQQLQEQQQEAAANAQMQAENQGGGGNSLGNELMNKAAHKAMDSLLDKLF